MNPIETYFKGEREESYIFIIMGVIAMAMALYFIFVLKSPFWKGVAIPFVIVACLELIVGYTIVTRSPKDLIRVESFVKNEPTKIETLEIPRMEIVLRNFVLYRYIEITLVILGISLMYCFSQNTFWNGLGLGLIIQASIVLMLDFFAERRGHIYLDYLNQLVDKP